jgi:hypothetical protein
MKSTIETLFKFLFEILNEMPIENLRKGIISYNDNPIQSINFFLKAISEDCDSSSIENLRKGIISYNDNPIQSINFFLKLLCSSLKLSGLDDLRKTLMLYPQQNWKDSFSLGQVKSKKWLLHELNKVYPKKTQLAYIYGGWLGVLPFIANLIDIQIAKKVRSFDINEDCFHVSESLNKGSVLNDWSFKAETIDITKITYPHHYLLTRANGSELEVVEKPDMIINTSCEHMDKTWLSSVQEGTLLVLQSNDFFNQEAHVNCVKSLDEFKEQFFLNEILFEGQLKLTRYTRFMLIGYK